MVVGAPQKAAAIKARCAADFELGVATVLEKTGLVKVMFIFGETSVILEKSDKV